MADLTVTVTIHGAAGVSEAKAVLCLREALQLAGLAVALTPDPAGLSAPNPGAVIAWSGAP